MKTLGILLSLLIAGIAAAWYVPTMIWGYQITKESQSIEEGDGSRLAELMNGPAPVKLLRNRKQLRGYYSLDELTSYRTVSVSIETPFESLLAPGEAVPDEIYHELYAMTRAPSLLIAMCPEILGELASKCDFGHSEGSIGRDGVVRISGQLEYIPAYDIGDPSKIKNGDLVTVFAQIIDGRDLVNTPESRQFAVERALSLCSALREKFGNCVISSLRLTPSKYEDQEILEVSASFAIHADKTLYRQKSVQAQLDRLAEDLLN